MGKLLQNASTVFMVKPICFAFNEETAVDNRFQRNEGSVSIQKTARAESENFINVLTENGVNVIYAEDTPLPKTPDSVFPNNWFLTLGDGTLVLFPMLAKNRRRERKDEFISKIKGNFRCKRVLDLTYFENENKFLEGTGSMVLDRQNKIVYACKSQRTNEEVLKVFCKETGFDYLLFDAVDKSGLPIYHTNVMLSVASDFVVLCESAIKDMNQLFALKNSFEKTGKKIVDISFEQMENFAGNMLEIVDKNGRKMLVMSKSAYNCLTNEQIEFFTQRDKITAVDLSCIEANGGGSARCMMAEIF